MIIGIDPGKDSGLVTLVNGEIFSLKTLSPEAVLKEIDKFKGCEGMTVIFEDSRLQPIFSRGTNARAAGRIARNVGMVDGQCRDIEDCCKRLGIRYIPISPKGKGRKLNAQAFTEMTGWQGKRTNSHERDAVLVAWPYRWGSR